MSRAALRRTAIGCQWIGIATTGIVFSIWLLSFFYLTVITLTIHPRNKGSRIVAEVGRKTYENGLMSPGHFILEHPKSSRLIIQSGSGYLITEFDREDYLWGSFGDGGLEVYSDWIGGFGYRVSYPTDGIGPTYNLPYWILLAILVPFTAAAIVARRLTFRKFPVTPSATSSPDP